MKNRIVFGKGARAQEAQALKPRPGEPGDVDKIKDAHGPLPKPAAPGLAATWEGVRVGFISVTPKLAKAWLAHNVKNRKLREDTVNGYARDVHADNWLVTPQGPAFNDANELINGQHTLHAIVHANRPAMLLVSFGWPAKPNRNGLTVMDVMDCGAPRSVANVLDLQHGIALPNLHAAIAKVIGCLCYPKRLRKATAPQTLAILKLYGKEIEKAIELRADLTALSSPKILGAAAFALAVHPKETEEFLRALNTSGGGSTVEQLREFLIRTASTKGQTSIADFVVRAELMLHCLLAFLKGESMRQLAHSKDGGDYFRSLQPDRVKIVHDLFDVPYFNPGRFAGGGGREVDIPAPSAKELEYQKLRAEMGIHTKEDEPEPSRL